MDEIDWDTRHALAPRQLSLSLSTDVHLRETVLGAVKGLGGCGMRVCDSSTLSPSVSHLLVPTSSASTPRPLKRTSKLLFAMARGVPVVKAEWVLASVSAGKWLEWEGFEALAAHPRAGRQLAGKRFHVAGCDAMDQPTLEMLIEAAGGVIVSRRSATHVVVPRGGGVAARGWEEAEGEGVGCVDDAWVFGSVMGQEGEGEEDSEDSEEF